MTDGDVEAVAKVIAQHNGYRDDTDREIAKGIPAWHDFVPCARAAISAYREWLEGQGHFIMRPKRMPADD